MLPYCEVADNPSCDYFHRTEATSGCKTVAQLQSEFDNNGGSFENCFGGNYASDGLCDDGGAGAAQHLRPRIGL